MSVISILHAPRTFHVSKSGIKLFNICSTTENTHDSCNIVEDFIHEKQVERTDKTTEKIL